MTGPDATPDPEYRPRGRPRDSGADERILRAVVALLLERGTDRMTMTDVAERAGVGKATVYRRWSSKDAMVVDALEELIGGEVPLPDTGSFRGDLEHIVADAVSFARSPAGRSLIRLSLAEASRDPRIAALHRGMLRRRLENAQVIFDRGVARGEIPAGTDAAWVTEVIVSMLAFRVALGLPLPAVDEVPRIVGQALHGGLPGPAEP